MVNDKRGISKPRNRISFRFRGDKVAVTFTISKLSLFLIILEISGKLFLEAFCVPGTGLSVLHIVSCLDLTTVL